jgi:hypothetical protein
VKIKMCLIEYNFFVAIFIISTRDIYKKILFFLILSTAQMNKFGSSKVKCAIPPIPIALEKRKEERYVIYFACLPVKSTGTRCNLYSTRINRQ